MARPGETAVPNLIGARLEAAVGDLVAAGLRLGATTGPREGFVVKQSPEAGAIAPRQTAVSLTLSATAATIAPPR
jgi:beta-lactam-binding protein with PASTA domain